MVACPYASSSAATAPTPVGNRRRAETPGLPPPEKRRWNEILSSASVILAGVLVVIGFGFVRAVPCARATTRRTCRPEAPTLGEVILPSASSSQA